MLNTWGGGLKTVTNRDVYKFACADVTQKINLSACPHVNFFVACCNLVSKAGRKEPLRISHVRCDPPSQTFDFAPKT